MLGKKFEEKRFFVNIGASINTPIFKKFYRGEMLEICPLEE